MKIISITFNNSDKEYSYLLDSKSFVIPKKNDLLYRSEGFKKGITFAAILKVKNIIDVEDIPDYVTSGIKILDINLYCQTYKLEQKKDINKKDYKIRCEQIYNFLLTFLRRD